MRRCFGILTVWLLLTANLSAQGQACPASPDEIWDSIAAGCDEQMPASLCYGHPTVSAARRQNQSESPRFLLPGDRIPLTSLDWFSTSSEAGTWGTARALFDAYPADSLDRQRAAMIFFGDLALFLPEQTDAPPLLDVEVAATLGANLRTSPAAAARVIKTLAYNRPLKAIGRSQDRRWALVYADPTLAAWVSQSVLRGDISSLTALPSDHKPAALWLPLQKFDFQAGLDDAPCADLPASGILLQTPKDADPRRFDINGTRLHLRGTAFLQAQSDMLVHALDGAALLQGHNGEVNISAGAFSRVPLDRDEDGALFPAASPFAPQAYDYHRLLNLPLDLLPLPARVGLDIYEFVSPRPADGVSPIAGMALDAPCTFTTGQSGANIRAQPDPQAAIIGVMEYRESAEPIARAIGDDGLPWWKLAEGVWIRIDATVSGGDCSVIPFIDISQNGQ